MRRQSGWGKEGIRDEGRNCFKGSDGSKSRVVVRHRYLISKCGCAYIQMGARLSLKRRIVYNAVSDFSFSILLLWTSGILTTEQLKSDRSFQTIRPLEIILRAHLRY